MRSAWAGALLLALGVSSTACADDAESSDADREPMSTPSPSVPASNANQDHGSTSYSYLLTSSCGYRGLFGTYAVVERDGVIESVETVGRGNGTRPRPRDIPTLRDLVAKAEEAKPADDVRLQVDDEGLPIFLEIKGYPRSQDDEECYVISELDVLHGTETTSTTEDIDLKGRWRLLAADIGGNEVAIPSDAHMTLVVRTTGTHTHVDCDYLLLVPHRLDGSDVSFASLDERRDIPTCPPSGTPAPLPARDYFEAFNAIDHAERTPTTLALTGPEVVLTFGRR